MSKPSIKSTSVLFLRNKLLPTLLVCLAMRKIFIILAMVMGISIVGAAQESPAKVEKQGNCIFVEKDTAKVSKPKAEPVYTGFTTKDSKGVIRKVYQGPKGGLFYINDKGSKVYVESDVKNRILAEMEKGGTK